MIVVRVELWSAVTGKRTELARMRISNDGTGTLSRRDYDGETLVGRSAEALNAGRISRRGRLTAFPSQEKHIWNLVAAMLSAMGYGA